MRKFLVRFLLVSSTISKPVEEGRCPYKTGKKKITSSVSQSLDLDKILGHWINYFDESELIRDFDCVSSKLQKVDDDRTLQFLNANSLTDETREFLRNEGDPDADKKYFINEGYKLHFNSSEDKSIANIYDFNAEISPKDKSLDPQEFIRYS